MSFDIFVRQQGNRFHSVKKIPLRKPFQHVYHKQKQKFIHTTTQQKAKLTACEYNEGTSDSSPEHYAAGLTPPNDIFFSAGD